MRVFMHRNYLSGAALLAALGLAACNQEPAVGSAEDNATVAQENGEATGPGTENETVSRVEDAVSGAVGTVSAQLTTTPEGYVSGAAIGDLFEVAAGRIALQRAESPEVKSFAQEMIDAHSQSSDELKSAVSSSGSSLIVPTALDDRRESMIENLRGAEASAFDERYIEQMINAHEEALILHRGFAENGENAELKSFAQMKVPAVEMHLAMAKALDEDEAGAQSSSR